MNDLSIYDTHATDWWSGSIRWLSSLHNMVPARMRYFDKFVDDWRGRDIMDLGCGGGFMAEALAKRGARVFGVDQSAQVIEAARHHAKDNGLSVNYVAGCGEQLEQPDNSIDIVVCVDVLEHVANVPKTISEISRVLRPNGLFLFDTINRNWLAHFFVVSLAENFFRILPSGAHDPDLFIKPTELLKHLEQNRLIGEHFAGLGPVGLDRRLNIKFGQIPTTLVQYMGVARKHGPTPSHKF